jgi:homoserine O-acetyltransferase
MARALDLLRQHLQIEQIALCLGGSQGGQIVQEWAIMQNQVFERLFLVATNAFHSPWGIAFNESQRMAIEADQTWKNANAEAGMAGLKAARSMALLSYRHYLTYQKTQSEDSNHLYDNFRASSYQQYQGEKLQKRFNAFSYWTLSKAMDSHHVGRNRKSISDALQQIKAKTLVLGIQSDILFPIAEQKLLAQLIPQARFEEIDSDYGHDGFLIENEQLQALLKDF